MADPFRPTTGSGQGYSANNPQERARASDPFRPTTGYGQGYSRNNPQSGSGGGKNAPSGPASGSGAPAQGQGSTAQDNAEATITQTLRQYGLPASLATWAWNEIVQGKTESQVVLDLYNTPEFKQRFPAIFTRIKNGLPPLSPGDYVSYENQAQQMFRAAGMPASFYSNVTDFTNLLANNVSINELGERLQLAQQAAYNTPPSVAAVLSRDYGIGPGDITAAWLDPDVAEPLLAQKYAAAQIGGAADQSGFGSDKATDDMLAQMGVTQAQAQQGFTNLAGQSQIVNTLPGEAGNGIDRSTQIAAEFEGNAAAQQAINLRTQQRQAAFAAGGSFASSSSGFGGIGTAEQT